MEFEPNMNSKTLIYAEDLMSDSDNELISIRPYVHRSFRWNSDTEVVGIAQLQQEVIENSGILPVVINVERIRALPHNARGAYLLEQIRIQTAGDKWRMKNRNSMINDYLIDFE